MARTDPQASPFPAEPESPPPQGPVAYPPAAAQYPPPNEATAYPPERPVAYPPPAAQQPTPSEPTHYPPQQSQATAYPPEGPASYPPNPTRYPPAEPTSYQTAPSKPTAYPPGSQPAAYPPKSQQPFQEQPQQYQAASRHQPPAYPQWRPSPPTQPQPKPSPFATGTPVTYPASQPVPPPQLQGNRFPPGAELWTTELFDCLADPNNALITYFMPCVTFGQIAEILDEGRQPCSTSAMIYALMMSLFGLHFFYSCSYRTKLRAKYNLMEQPLPDALVHYFCGPCALCQEYRELKNRGIDPAHGWLGVIQGPQVRMAPPQRQTMYQY